MSFSKTQHSIYEFNSIPHSYKGLSEPDLKLEIYEHGSDALEVKLTNNNYQKQRRLVKKQFVCLILSCYAYLMCILFTSLHKIYIDVLIILWLIPLLWRLFNLVEAEKFIYCYDFGIHLQVQKFVGKSNSFIAASNIHDIVINEVLENLDFRYLLIIRTKGKLFHKKPIIPIFKVFKPCCDCLSIIYKHLNKVMAKP